MNTQPLRDQILGLPPKERFELLADVWDSFAAEPEAVPVPDWHRAELDRRLANPDPGHLTWTEVQKQSRETD